MKLAFNGVKSGLGNNGGSRTILLSSQVLESLGHRCDIISFKDDFTWFSHKPPIKYIPSDLDAIVNIAAVDYEATRNTNIPIKAAYWRGHEIWANDENYLRHCYTDIKIKNIVNSKGVQQLLSGFGADSEVVYQGIDFNLWKDRKLRSKDKIRIGCLYQEKPTKRWIDFVKLSEILGTKDYEYVGIGLSKREDTFLTRYWSNVSVEELNEVYSSCHIWLAPTELEGLHNVPMEAALCGCIIVCSNSLMNGMCLDYAFHNNTAMVYEARNIEQAAEMIKSPNTTVVDRMYKHLRSAIGTREDNMKKMIKCLENRL